MSKTSKKQTFLGGAAVLALSTAIVKIIGALYKIPIKSVIGADGFGYFNSAYDIYNVLLMIATTGLPVAMSRMVSEASALQNPGQIRRIYDVSKRVFLIIGVVGTLFMSALCIPLADLIGQRNAWFPILCLSPAVLLICLISVNRGFFQGQGDMRPTSISQVIEAACKLVVGLSLAFVIMWFFRKNGLDTSVESPALSKAHSWAAGGAIVGVTLGCALAGVYLSAKVRKTDVYKTSAEGAVKSGRETAKELLKIAVPITVGAAGLQLINLADTAVYMWRLKDAAGFTQQHADDIKGVYNFCQTIFNLPCAFITPIVVAVIPALTEAITKKDAAGKRAILDSAMRVMALIAAPCAVGLAVLSGPIYALLSRGASEAEVLQATPLLAILGVSVLFNSTVLVTNGIMQSHGDVNIPVIHMLIGGALKLVLTFILVGVPEINMIGAALSTLCCYVLISGLNLFAMAKRGYTVNVLKTMGKPILAALVMGAAAYGVKTLLIGRGLSNLPVTAVSIVVAGALYVLLAIVMRTITKADCTLLPKGDKIAKLLKIKE